MHVGLLDLTAGAAAVFRRSAETFFRARTSEWTSSSEYCGFNCKKSEAVSNNSNNNNKTSRCTHRDFDVNTLEFQAFNGDFTTVFVAHHLIDGPEAPQNLEAINGYRRELQRRKPTTVNRCLDVIQELNLILHRLGSLFVLKVKPFLFELLFQNWVAFFQNART